MTAATGEPAFEPTELDLPDSIVFYDGVCGLCAWSVRWLVDHDRDGRLHFAPLQGETARALGIPWDADAPPSEASVAFVDTTGTELRIEHRSRAAAAALEQAGVADVLRRVTLATPRPVADFVYRIVAAVRYRLFGKHDECRIPSPDQRARFLP